MVIVVLTIRTQRLLAPDLNLYDVSHNLIGNRGNRATYLWGGF